MGIPSPSPSPYAPLRGGTCASAEVMAASGAARVPIARMAKRTRFMFVSTVVLEGDFGGGHSNAAPTPKVASFRVQPLYPLGRCARTFAEVEDSHACRQARSSQAQRLERQVAERQGCGAQRRRRR